LKPALGKQLVRLYLKKIHHKTGWWNSSRDRPSVQTPEPEKNKIKRVS
jgi:hypothetical protein